MMRKRDYGRRGRSHHCGTPKVHWCWTKHRRKVVACRPWDTVATGRPQKHHAKGAHGIMAKNDDSTPRGTTPFEGALPSCHRWEGAHGIGRGLRAWPQIGFCQAKKDRVLRNAFHHATCVQPRLLHALAFQRRWCVYMRARARTCVRIRACVCGRGHVRYRC